MTATPAPAGAPPAAAGRAAAPPWLAFAFCCSVWGSTFLFIRMGNDTLPPVWAAALRLTLASVLLALLAVAVRAPWPRGRQLEAALGFGFVDFGVSLPLLYWGEHAVSSGVAAVLYALVPLVTALLAFGFGLEPLRPAQLVGALLGVGGVALLFTAQLAGAIPAGALVAVLAAAVTAGLAGVLLKRAPGGHPLATNAIAHAIGALVCLLASALLREPHGLPGAAGWTSVLYLTLVGSVGAFVAFAWLLQRWSVTRASFIAVVVPAIAVGLGALVRHERLAPRTLAGAGVILAAVVLGLTAGRAARTAD